MSTTEKEGVRSFASLLAETILIKNLGWDYGFLSGGIGAFSQEKLLELLKLTNEIMGEKVWVNVGVIGPKIMEKFKPYIKGIVGTVEILDEKLHKQICPSKPLAPVETMFEQSLELGLENAMTLIIGLGEEKDFSSLKAFITKYKITKIHVYGLNPIKGTEFENASPPSKELQSWWIKNIRESFPSINIQCGIWIDRADYVEALLKAGANSISKLPAIRKFGSKEMFDIEDGARKAGRIFRGSLTKLPKVDWFAEVEKLSVSDELKKEIKIKLDKYLEKMNS